MAGHLFSIGDVAPDFELPSVAGSTVHLYQVLERSPVVLFFLIKAFTPVCVAETCAFRDHMADFRLDNFTILGVSSDSPAIARQFARVFQVPFPLLVDRRQRVRRLYGVPKVLGIIPGRATFTIGRSRLIEQVIQSQFNPKRHAMKSMEALRAK